MVRIFSDILALSTDPHSSLPALPASAQSTREVEERRIPSVSACQSKSALRTYVFLGNQSLMLSLKSLADT